MSPQHRFLQMRIIDINCDLGEIEGERGRSVDSELLRWVTSANVACGGHAGSHERMRQLTVECRTQRVSFGAHPGYADREHFGRRIVPMSSLQLYEMVKEQLRVIADIAYSEGVQVSHVKPHGALYNLAAVDMETARTLAETVQSVLPGTKLFGLAGSELIQAGKLCGLCTVSEVFADRNYQANGTLVPRDQPQAVIHDPEEIAERAARMIETGTILTLDGHTLPIVVETICVHSDTPEAVDVARHLSQKLHGKAN